MTKLPQTISKTVNILTGEECQRGCIPDGRCSGRTVAIALGLISSAMSSTDRHAYGIDHAGWERRHADVLLYEVLDLIRKAGLIGFKAEVRRVSQLRGVKGLSGIYGNSDEVCGVYLQWNQVQEVFYDLRK